MDVLWYLNELGLSKNESELYVVLLERGRSTIAELATHSKVHRVNIYDVVKSLKKEGLITEINIGKKKLYLAESPDSLKNIIQQKESILEELLPVLKSKYNKVENHALVFEGVDGIKRIFEDMLATNREIRAFGIPRELPEKLGGYLNVFHRKRIEKEIKIRHIYNENARKRIKYLNKLKYSQARYLPPEFTVPATTVIYGDKVVLWVWSDNPFSVVIESSKMAEAYIVYFEFLWKIAKH